MKFLTTQEAAKRLGVATARIRQLCIAKQMPGAKKFGLRAWMVPVAAVEARIARKGAK